MTSRFGHHHDLIFMDKALEQARLAFQAQEVPIGAIIVDASGTIIAAAHNKVEHESTQLAHAETRALELAGKALNDWRLSGCWLYVTLEPCMMCLSAARLSRVEGIVFGAASPQFGYRLDNNVAYQLYKDDTIKIIEGVRAQESADVLRTFFQKKRILSE